MPNCTYPEKLENAQTVHTQNVSWIFYQLCPPGAFLVVRRDPWHFWGIFESLALFPTWTRDLPSFGILCTSAGTLPTFHGHTWEFQGKMCHLWVFTGLPKMPLLAFYALHGHIFNGHFLTGHSAQITRDF